MGNRIYGCDDCLAVCPWNKFAQATREAKLQAREDLAAPDLGVLAELEDDAFRRKFSGSPIKRIGRDRFMRNVLIAIGNSGNPGLREIVRSKLDEPAAIVRGAAVWALSQLEDKETFNEMKTKLGTSETDPVVRCEWGFDA